MIQDKNYLDASATAVYRQLEENLGIFIPVDPEVAEHMGAFVDESLSAADALASDLSAAEE